MATVSRSFPELAAVQRKGLKLVVVGLLVFVTWPVLYLGGVVRYIGSGLGYFIVSSFGACLLVWGAYVLRTGEREPLTPRRALLIPIFVLAMFTVVDLLARGEWFIFWEQFRRQWPDLHYRGLALTIPYSSAVVSSLYAIPGAAFRMRRPRVALASLGLFHFLFSSLAGHAPLGAIVFWEIVIGIVPFGIGYRAASTPEGVTPIGTIITEMSDTEWRGVKLAVLGMLSFAAFPVLRLAGILEWGGGGLWVLLLSTYGACILVWGVYVLRTETKRPLTPKRALLIPLLVAAMAVATDLLTRGRLVEWWVDSRFQGPLHNLDVFGRRFQQLGHIGASMYVVLGAAARSEQWSWVLVSVGLILGVSWILELIPYGSWMFVLVAIFGIVPAIIGYRATKSPEETTEG